MIPAGTAPKDGAMDLTEKQKAFADAYLVDFNASAAAKRAGYSLRSAHVQGCNLLKKPKVQKYLQEQREKAHNAAIMTLEEAMERLSRLARRDVSDYVDAGGHFDTQGKDTYAISGMDRVLDKDGDCILKVRMADPHRAIEQLAKLKGWNAPERHEHTITSFVDLLRSVEKGDSHGVDDSNGN